MSAERVRGASAAPATTVRALLATLLLVLLALPFGLSAAAARPLAATLAAPESGASALAVTAAPQQSGVVATDGSIVVRVVATNTSETPTPPATANLLIAAGAPAGTETLESWFGEGDADVRPSPVASVAIPPLEPGATAMVELQVAAAAAGLAGEWGPRPIEVSVVQGDAVLGSARSAIVWVPEGTTPPVATVVGAVPLTAPGIAGGFIPAEELAELTAPGGLLLRTLDSVAGRPVAIGVDPRVIASIRILGTTAPESAIAFLDRLALVPNDTFALAWADADPLVTAQARGIPLPPVEGAGGAIDPSLLTGEPAPDEDAEGQGEGDPSPSASPSTDPGATPSPSGEPVVPTLEELAAWPHDLTGVAWPAEGLITSDALATAASAGTTTAIISGDSLEGADGLVGAAGEVRVLRVDAALSRAARDAASAVNDQQWQSAIARASSLIAASSGADAADVPFMTLSRDALRDSSRVLELLGAIEALPWARGGSLVTASAASGPPVTIIDAPISEERAAEVGRMLDTEAADREFASVAVDPALITDERRLELLAALSIGWDDESSAAAAQYVERGVELRSSVQIVESTTITLLSDRTSLPVTVQNDLDVAVRVFVRVDSFTARLRVVEPRVETIVEPQSQTRALVPVQSLTNGEVGITIDLLDAENEPVGAPTVVQLNLQAGWETAAIVVIGVLVGGLFLFGVSRDIMRRRSRRAEEAAA